MSDRLLILAVILKLVQCWWPAVALAPVLWLALEPRQ